MVLGKPRSNCGQITDARVTGPHGPRSWTRARPLLVFDCHPKPQGSRLSPHTTASSDRDHERTALVVDDDRLIRWALGRQLAALGVSARAVETASDAIAELRQRAFDLIFLDVHLPDANGVDLFPMIGATSPAAQVVVMSADASEDDLARASAGGARFVAKPFDLSTIRRIVREPPSLPRG
jgi:CheY-like chemotaxis protein